MGQAWPRTAHVTWALTRSNSRHLWCHGMSGVRHARSWWGPRQAALRLWCVQHAGGRCMWPVRTLQGVRVNTGRHGTSSPAAMWLIPWRTSEVRTSRRSSSAPAAMIIPALLMEVHATRKTLKTRARSTIDGSVAAGAGTISAIGRRNSSPSSSGDATIRSDKMQQLKGVHSGTHALSKKRSISPVNEAKGMYVVEQTSKVVCRI